MFIELLERLQGYRLSKPVVICGMVIIALGASLLIGRLTEMTVMVVVGFIFYGIYKIVKMRSQLREDMVALSSNLDDTAELHAVVDETGAAVSSEQPRDVVVDADGVSWLVVNKTELHRRHIFSKAERTTSTSLVQIVPGPVMDADQIKRFPYEPIDGEKQVFVFNRLHWMSHAPIQILLVVIEIIVTIGLIIYSPVGFMFSASFWLAFTLVIVFFYLREWIKWAYTYFAVTDSRIMYMYQPPFWIEGEPMRSLMNIDILTANHVDQSGFTNWVLQKFGQTPYGIISADTSAEHGDEFIRNGLRYVRHPEIVKRIMDERRLAVRSYPLRSAEALEKIERRGGSMG